MRHHRARYPGLQHAGGLEALAGPLEVPLGEARNLLYFLAGARADVPAARGGFAADGRPGAALELTRRCSSVSAELADLRRDAGCVRVALPRVAAPRLPHHAGAHRGASRQARLSRHADGCPAHLRGRPPRHPRDVRGGEACGAQQPNVRQPTRAGNPTCPVPGGLPRGLAGVRITRLATLGFDMRDSKPLQGHWKRSRPVRR
mmetsp:Transcript_114551/g.356744  ORF Transcript_114551/g.356744 Transcript_114551/m.356744 type:complete len:203 (+) Transcript_114551:959-1567(+)